MADLVTEAGDFSQSDLRSFVAAIASVCAAGFVVARLRQAAAPPRLKVGRNSFRLIKVVQQGEEPPQRRSSSYGSQVVEFDDDVEMCRRGRSPPRLPQFSPHVSLACTSPMPDQKSCRLAAPRFGSSTETSSISSSATALEASLVAGKVIMADCPRTPPRSSSESPTSRLSSKSGGLRGGTKKKGVSIEAALLAACLPLDSNGTSSREVSAIAVRWREWRGSGDEIFGVTNASRRRRENLLWRLWWQACQA
eukprot:TRINITY_DN61738_c0_g1_i1.p1 TRINITY_DN61738_c0_g1~~TRINITY_DN61738_c0_g1_i1.p1  ORF type:complete len:251 (+),score=29.55 TRINITY_DN61738_c0_g1_i1:219-971(+)